MRSVVVALAGLALASCARDPFVVKRTLCPAVAVPQYAGDATLFQPGRADAGGIDVTATLTQVRGTCDESGGAVRSAVRFAVVARRADARAPRTVDLPVFVAVVRGGGSVVAKQATAVRLDFAAGQARAVAEGGAAVGVSRQAALLPRDIDEKITRERKPGDIDAASDPLAEPSVREAVRAATFEVLVGFQLDEAALAYNATK